MASRGAGQGYAKGKWALGECARSGRKMLLKHMIADGYYPNLIVDPEWYEGKHPQESLPAIKDPVALYRPAPERDRIGSRVIIRGVGGNDLALGYELANISFDIQPPPPDLVFVRDVGSFYNKDVDGDNQPIPQPATKNVDDDLFLMVVGGFQDPIVESGTTWTLEFTITAAGTETVRLYKRKATNDSNDVATYNGSSTRNILAQMMSVSWNASLGPVTDTLANVQSGGLNNIASGGSDIWDIFSMPVGAVPTNTFVIGFWWAQRLGVAQSSPTIGNITGLTLIDEIAVAQASPSETQWFGWGVRFDGVSAAVAAVQQTYGALQTFRNQSTQYTRWEVQ